MPQPDHDSSTGMPSGEVTEVDSQHHARIPSAADGFASLQRFKQLWQIGPPPDVTAYVAALGPVSDDLLAAILRADLHYRWAAGRALPVEWYLERFKQLTQLHDLAVDLIYAEYLQAEKFGQKGGADEYFLRFPQHRDTLRDQFELHNAICDEDAGIESATADSNVSRQKPKRSFPDVPGYQILEEIGRGGIGVVYRAHDPRLNRTVALKLLLSGAHASAVQLRRFHVEAEAAARLQHRNIVQIYEISAYEGRPYLVLEFVTGGNLGDHYHGQPQAPRWSAALVEQLARTVEFAHQHGVIHRDLKPTNVMLEASGKRGDERVGNSTFPKTTCSLPTPKITDFGLAKLTGEGASADSDDATCTGDILGTPSYMSPEQASGRVQEIGVQTDVYALGAILYELLTGRPPFVGATPIETLRQVAENEPIHPSRLVRQIAPDLQTICLKCLEKDPNKRYASALNMAEDLARFLNDRPILARRTASLERAWRWSRRNPLVASLWGSIAALVVLIAVVASVSSLRLSKQLAETRSAEHAERQAKSETLDRLWDSLLAESRAYRTSRRLGQRFKGLEAIASAKAMFDSGDLTSDRRAALRNSAIASLALPDLRRMNTWRDANRSIAVGFVSNGDLTRYACQKSNGDVEVRRVGDGTRMTIVPAQPAKSKLMLSHDGHWLGVLNIRFQAWYIEGLESRLVLDESAGGWWSFSPDSRFALGTTADGILRRIDLETGQHVRDLGSRVSTTPIAISPQGNLAALVADKKIHLIDLQTGRITREFESPLAMQEEICLSWNPNGETFTASPYPDGVREWDVRSGARLTGYSHDAAFITAFDETGALFISHSPWDGLTRLWDTRGGKSWLSIPGIAFSDLEPMPSGGFRLIADSGPDRLEMWEVAPQRIYRSAAWTANVGNWLHRLGFSPDGRLLAISAKDGVSIIDTRSGAALATLNMGLNATDFDAAGQLITASSAGLFRWSRRDSDHDPSSTNPSRASDIDFLPPASPQHSDAKLTVTMAVSRDGHMIATVSGDNILVWPHDHPEKPLKLGPHQDVRSVAFSPDGKWLASGGWGSPGGAKIWDLASGRLIEELPVGLLCAVDFSPDGRFLATSPRGGEVWRTNDWTRQSKLRSRDNWASGLSFTFSPNGAVLAVTTSDGRIRVVDPETGRDHLILADPNQHRVRDCVFSPDGTQLATISSDDGGAIHIWDLSALGVELDRLGLLWMGDLPGTIFGLPAIAATLKSNDGPLTVTFGRNPWIEGLEKRHADQAKMRSQE